MQKIVFATNNKKKLTEVKSLLSDSYEVLSLEDIACFDDIEETGKTFHENAAIKALHVYNKFGLDCFADDSGLEVDGLNGAPGVFSARFAGEPRDDSRNNQLLLEKLREVPDRSAGFKTVIALCRVGKLDYFEGIIRGNIIEELRGDQGFGYDPLFVPSGYSQTFAEMGLSEKNKISHRAIAVNKLVDFLKKSH